MTVRRTSKLAAAWEAGRAAGVRYAQAKAAGRNPRRPTNPHIVPTPDETWKNIRSGTLVQIIESDLRDGMIHYKLLTGRQAGTYGWRRADRFRYHFTRETD